MNSLEGRFYKLQRKVSEESCSTCCRGLSESNVSHDHVFVFGVISIPRQGQSTGGIQQCSMAVVGWQHHPDQTELQFDEASRK